MLVEIRGAGDLATGIALRLHRAGLQVVMCDISVPTAVRRTVSFSEAICLGEYEVEGVRARLAASPEAALAIVRQGDVAVIVDEDAKSARSLQPQVLVDAIIAKRNLGTRMDMAPVVIGVGPGFAAGIDCHAAIETKRGHYLGSVLYKGSPIPNTGVPGNIGGFTTERVLRAPSDGLFHPLLAIGDEVRAGDIAATVGGVPLPCTIDGILRGLLQEGVPVFRGMKAGDIDPRCERAHCFSASDKARAVGGGVLEAICHFTHRLEG